MRSRSGFVSASLAISLGSTALAGGGSFTLLGVNGLFPSGVSTNGAVVAGYNTSQFWYWTSAQGLTFIGGVSPNAGGAGSADISNSGTRIGYTVINPATGKTEAAFYDIATGTSTSAGNFGFSCDASATSCWGMSGDGTTIVGLGWHNLCAARGFKYSATGGLVDLGTLVSGFSSRANACSGNGSVIAGWQDTALERQAAYWKNGVEKLILTQTGQPLGEAGVVSNDGNWILGLGSASNSNLAWRFSEQTGYLPLPATPIAGFRGYPTGISDDASRILMFYRTPFPPATAGEGYLWINGALNSLETLAAAEGVAIPTGVRMALPLAISGDGYTIVGTARTPAGIQGFVLDLPRPPSCTADLTGDGAVSSADITVLLSAWGATGGPADLNGDGTVSSADITVLLSAWGTCP